MLASLLVTPSAVQLVATQATQACCAVQMLIASASNKTNTKTTMLNNLITSRKGC
jgi:hypothetical protein